MTSLSVKTITGLYLGLSAMAFYFMMHAALNQQQLQPASAPNTVTSVSWRPSTGSSSTSTGSSGGSSTSPSSSGSGSLASQQYDETSNWAGYASTGGTYTGISGSWNVPTATGAGETAADAAWIGIGGVTSDDLIQVGTQNIVTADGQVDTSAFYELLPGASEPINALAVNPGDTVTASISETGSGEWRITLDDSSNGGSFSTDVAYTSSESSAEWIEEDPSDGNGQQIPFDSFGTIGFTGDTTIDDGTTVSVAKSNAQAVSMINGEDQPLASVSSLSSNGEGFSVTRTTASSIGTTDAFDNDPTGWIRRGSGMGFGGGYGQFGEYRQESHGH